MSALVGCHNCGFVTRRNSHLGKTGRCPHCASQLREMSFFAARVALRQRRPQRTSA